MVSSRIRPHRAGLAPWSRRSDDISRSLSQGLEEFSSAGGAGNGAPGASRAVKSLFERARRVGLVNPHAAMRHHSPSPTAIVSKPPLSASALAVRIVLHGASIPKTGAAARATPCRARGHRSAVGAGHRRLCVPTVAQAANNSGYTGGLLDPRQNPMFGSPVCPQWGC
jgi:hypothetical protein